MGRLKSRLSLSNLGAAFDSKHSAIFHVKIEIIFIKKRLRNRKRKREDRKLKELRESEVESECQLGIYSFKKSEVA